MTYSIISIILLIIGALALCLEDKYHLASTSSGYLMVAGVSFLSAGTFAVLRVC